MDSCHVKPVHIAKGSMLSVVNGLPCFVANSSAICFPHDAEAYVAKYPPPCAVFMQSSVSSFVLTPFNPKYTVGFPISFSDNFLIL